MRCRQLVCVCALWCAIAGNCCGVALAAQPPAAPVRPNVVFILADDLGWGDLGCYGHPVTKTPQLDALAARGTLFTNFYVNASVCSPSRCAFFTGQYPARHRIHGHYSSPEANESRGMSQFLNPEVPNVARLLKGAGYTTAHIGKWHLGSDSGGPPPGEYGFDYVGSTETGGAPGPTADPYFRARSTELFVDEAIAFVERSGDQPFYLQLWTLVPHATLNPTVEQTKPYRRLRANGANFPHAAAQELFSASVTDLDTQLGRLFATLEQRGLSGKTLVIFSSDNGPEDIHIRNAGHTGVGSAGPFRGRKRSLYEGGIRVPGIISWRGVIPAGVVDTESVLAAVDLLPTVAQWAGAAVPASHALDGENVGDLLQGHRRARQKPLFWEWRFSIAGEPFHHSPQLAIREGNWKLLMNPDGSRQELYDLSSDLTQLNNVAEHHTDEVQRLADQLLTWQATLPAGPRDGNAGQMHAPVPNGMPPLGKAARGKSTVGNNKNAP